MKIYVLDNMEVERDAQDNLISRTVFSIIHYESDDFVDTPSAQAEEVQWSPEKLILELTQGDREITGIPGIELVRDRHYPDGRIERIQTLAIDVTSAYALLEHLQMIDNENPDGLFW